MSTPPCLDKALSPMHMQETMRGKQEKGLEGRGRGRGGGGGEEGGGAGKDASHVTSGGKH